LGLAVRAPAFVYLFALKTKNAIELLADLIDDAVGIVA